MSDFFTFTENPDNTFTVFGWNHIIPLLAIIVGVYLIYHYRYELRNYKYERRVRYGIAIFAILLEVSFQLWQMFHGQWDFADSLPLHLCRLTSYLGIYIMFSKNTKVFEIAYFWSLAGVVSILFPDILHGADRYRYYHFMMSHILFFYMYMYLLFVLDFRLTFKSFKKSFITLFVLAVGIIIPINNIFNMNYMYLLEPGDTPFTIFEGHGYLLYVIGCIGLTMVVITLWYLPIHFYNRYRKE
ncbi:TIGR02206 family membrane protein [Candidatus Xianfuyuplasma coldseepsis]|uniref:TIGR02206 family membrane protein n=1 Tax=Candidatus Xianfuyuplasma coldseepsis TaxID=2782163 RepID=A0A7L7KTQ0_9MOLU|nr:TIGR02206 family membrane protein [Xianfuyuplasma coldseepsis]QMS85799.1 TIGR02206 family membrane protein [Xianfuyuplasma coldseepsis]